MIQTNGNDDARILVLLYKLDMIQQHINQRLEVVDPVTRSELEFVLNMLRRYEDVPGNYIPPATLIDHPEEEGANNNETL